MNLEDKNLTKVVLLTDTGFARYIFVAMGKVLTSWFYNS